jgi:hypothetical protein
MSYVTVLRAECHKAQQECIALAARLAEAERDAARYRWLRMKTDDPVFWRELLLYFKAAEFDACVDRGMADSADASLPPPASPR